MKFGTEILADGRIKFNFWAPDEKKVRLCLPDQNLEIPMNNEEDGWFYLTTNRATIGSKYQFLLDNGLKVPDPASRQQADDVHGASIVTAPDNFDWGNDADWKGRPWEEVILYELHVGTFTPEGTFRAIKEKLDYFVELGITAIELMPVADFPGKRGWGYDGVLLFAPESAYGTPEDLKDLIKAAHEKGIMVFLDVVYNHFGPDGNYLYVYAKSRFFEHKHITPWGDAINFEDTNVRDFYIQNALYWLEEFRFDGFRLDAVQEIKDDSKVHILEELSQTIKERVKDRHIHLVLENDDNNAALLNPKYYDAQWNDDFHHCMHIQLTGEKSGYYADYAEIATENKPEYYLARCFAEGFAYQGEPSHYRDGEKRGQNTQGLLISSFVNFIQNHDQVGNRAFGERLSDLTSKDSLIAATAAYILTPSIPLLFMGEEWASKSPFLFFCDFGEDLSRSVREGRRKEFAKFPEFSDPKKIDLIPDPTSEKTFLKSKLDWENLDKKEHKEVFELYKTLLKIRKEQIMPLIKEIEFNKTIFEIIENKAIKVKWHTCSEKTPELILNLSDKNIKYEYEKNKNYIFKYSTSDIDGKNLAPSTVLWSINK